MDLRVAKTKNRIVSAFLALRDKLMPEKIKVKDICRVAMINKTTFYKHYNDSLELSNEISELAINGVVSAFTSKDKIFENPREYVSGLLESLEVNSQNLMVVFRGNHNELSARLADRLIAFHRDSLVSSEHEIRLSFAIGGFLRVVNDYIFARKKYDRALLSEYVTELISALPSVTEK